MNAEDAGGEKSQKMFIMSHQCMGKSANCVGYFFNEFRDYPKIVGVDLRMRKEKTTDGIFVLELSLLTYKKKV